MRLASCVTLALLALAGCNSSNGITVVGTVTRSQEPLGDAVVTFIPIGETTGLGGSAKTGKDGKYVIMSARGGDQIAPGDYKVTISLYLRKDGTLPDLNTPPIEADASEKLPPKYSDREATTLTAKVTAENKAYDFELK